MSKNLGSNSNTMVYEKNKNNVMEVDLTCEEESNPKVYSACNGGKKNLTPKTDRKVEIKLRSFASLSKESSKREKCDMASSSVVSSAPVCEPTKTQWQKVDCLQSGQVHLKYPNDLVSNQGSTTLPETNKAQKDITLLIKSVYGTLSDSSCGSALPSFQPNIGDNAAKPGVDNFVNGTNCCVVCKKSNPCMSIVSKPECSEQKDASAVVCSNQCRMTFLTASSINKKSESIPVRSCGHCWLPLAADSNQILWQAKEFCKTYCLAAFIGNLSPKCSHCGKGIVLLNIMKYCITFGPTSYQFCSESCVKGFQLGRKFCGLCQSIIWSDRQKTGFCSSRCLRRRDMLEIGQKNYKKNEVCLVCQNKTINSYCYQRKNNLSELLCSEKCLCAFIFANKLPLKKCYICNMLVNLEIKHPSYNVNGLQKIFCSESCKGVYIVGTRRLETCVKCHVRKYDHDMIKTNPAGNSSQFYCSILCLHASMTTEAIAGCELPTNKTPREPTTSDAPTVSCPPVVKRCEMCREDKLVTCHMVMSDGSYRSFCCYECAVKYKETYGFEVTKKTDKVPEATSVPADVVLKKCDDKLEEFAKLINQFGPKDVCNKSTSCNLDSETNESDKDAKSKPVFIPVPVPIFVPAPMMMYSANVPVPLFMPFPIPIPMPIPTTEKTAQDIANKMKAILESKESSGNQSAPSPQPNDRTKNDSDEVVETNLDQNIPSDTPESEKDIEDCGKRKRDDDEQSVCKKSKIDTEDDKDTQQVVMNLWKSWVIKKNEALMLRSPTSKLLKENFLDNSIKILDHCLSIFVVEVGDLDHRLNNIDELFKLCLEIQMVLMKQSASCNIFSFEKFPAKFDNILHSSLIDEDSGQIIVKKFKDTCVSEKMLWESKQLGTHNAHILLFTLTYFITKIRKLVTAKDHLSLTRSDLLNSLSQEDLEEMDVSCEPDLSNLETDSNIQLKLFPFYLSKCSTRSSTLPVYCVPETTNTGFWFNEEPLPLDTIQSFLNRILLVREIQQAL